MLEPSFKAPSLNPQAPRTRRPTPLLAPNLLAALSQLAATEDLPVAALIAVLINEALDRRLHRRRSS